MSTSSNTEDCILLSDPAQLQITVDGVDEETKVLMQNTLNVEVIMGKISISISVTQHKMAVRVLK